MWCWYLFPSDSFVDYCQYSFPALVYCYLTRDKSDETNWAWSNHNCFFLFVLTQLKVVFSLHLRNDKMSFCWAVFCVQKTYSRVAAVMACKALFFFFFFEWLVSYKMDVGEICKWPAVTICPSHLPITLYCCLGVQVLYCFVVIGACCFDMVCGCFFWFCFVALCFSLLVCFVFLRGGCFCCLFFFYSNSDLGTIVWDKNIRAVKSLKLKKNMQSSFVFSCSVWK